MNNDKLNIHEIRITIGVCIIFILRMFGMFMVTPAMHTTGILFPHASKFLIGVAIGIYGLMQAIFQIPFGYLSNRIGYKYTILIGLFVFCIGSIILWYSHSIFGIILGRSLQGIGTVSSIFIALLANVIREHNYIKSISCIGISFGISFLSAIILGPIIIGGIGLYGLFKIIILLSVICIYVAVRYIFPYCDKIFSHKKNKIIFYQTNSFIQKYDIFGYIISIFCLHFLLTINFIIFPKNMELLGYVLKTHFEIYFIMIIFSLFITIPLIIIAEKKKYIRVLMISVILMLLISCFLLLIFPLNFFIFFISMCLFFIAFIISETFLPSLLSRILPIKYKNIIMSIYSTSQFLGIALGGIIGGLIYQYFGMMMLFILGVLVSILWLIIFIFITKPKYTYSTSVFLKKKCIYKLDITPFLKTDCGIISIEYVRSDNIVFIKFDSEKTDINDIIDFLKYKI
ncbi:MFS transporter [Buchnera aphidicola (Takecallis taiwana)]|uniref:MFS transporter n=1 Tax=Buchnera aphidicola TaxID=9 RepID=UPI0031B6EF6B